MYNITQFKGQNEYVAHFLSSCVEIWKILWFLEENFKSSLYHEPVRLLSRAVLSSVVSDWLVCRRAALKDVINITHRKCLEEVPLTVLVLRFLGKGRL